MRIKRRKIIGLMLSIVLAFGGIGFSVSEPVKPVNDLEFMKENYFKGDIYTFKQVSVNESDEGSVLSQSGTEFSNLDVYTLTVNEAGLVSLFAQSKSSNYYRNLTIDGPLMVIDDQNSKRIEFAGTNNQINIDDYNGYGNYYVSVFLEPGTYFFSVGGKAYSQPEMVNNYLEQVPYHLSVEMTPFLQDPNRDTNESSAYTLAGERENVVGSIGMLLNAQSNGDFIVDQKDRYYVPAGHERDVTVVIENNDSTSLRPFNRKLNYQRGDSPTNLELRTLENTFDTSKALRVVLESQGQVKLISGEQHTYQLHAEADKMYYIDIFSSIPANYSIGYTSSNIDIVPDVPIDEPSDLETPDTNEGDDSPVYENLNEEPEAQDETIEPDTNAYPETEEIPYYITLFVHDESTQSIATLKHVIVNGVECTINEENIIENQSVPNFNDTFEIFVEAEGFKETKFVEPIKYEGINMVHVYMTDAQKIIEDTNTEDNKVNPIIMLHTACDIPASVFDNHDYDIFVDHVNFNDQEGYMGHITNLPASSVGDRYRVEVHVDGYEPYTEEIVIPKSEYDDGNAVVFVNVNTQKVSKEKIEVTEEDETLDLTSASSWAKALITDASEVGLTTEKMRYDYSGITSREAFAELVMKLYNSLGGSMVSTYNPYIDTTNPDVINAYNADIIGGTSVNTFSPNNSITREQLCVMILKTIKASGIDLDTNGQYRQNYSDIGSISSWAEESVRTLNHYGVISGSGDALDPQGVVSKEMAIIMCLKTYNMFN